MTIPEKTLDQISDRFGVDIRFHESAFGDKYVILSHKLINRGIYLDWHGSISLPQVEQVANALSLNNPDLAWELAK